MRWASRYGIVLIQNWEDWKFWFGFNPSYLIRGQGECKNDFVRKCQSMCVRTGHQTCREIQTYNLRIELICKYVRYVRYVKYVQKSLYSYHTYREVGSHRKTSDQTSQCHVELCFYIEDQQRTINLLRETNDLHSTRHLQNIKAVTSHKT